MIIWVKNRESKALNAAQRFPGRATEKMPLLRTSCVVIDSNFRESSLSKATHLLKKPGQILKVLQRVNLKIACLIYLEDLWEDDKHGGDISIADLFALFNSSCMMFYSGLFEVTL